MTTITLEVPDDLAIRLSPPQGGSPKLLIQALVMQSLDSLFAGQDAANGESRGADINSPVYLEAFDFLTSRPTLEQIAEFKISASLQDRVEELLGKNRENGLTEQEAAEMNTFLKINHIMILLKAHAQKALRGRGVNILGRESNW